MSVYYFGYFLSQFNASAFFRCTQELKVSTACSGTDNFVFVLKDRSSSCLLCCLCSVPGGINSSYRDQRPGLARQWARQYQEAEVHRRPMRDPCVASEHKLQRQRVTRQCRSTKAVDKMHSTGIDKGIGHPHEAQAEDAMSGSSPSISCGMVGPRWLHN
jgi:hypothetical protein